MKHFPIENNLQSCIPPTMKTAFMLLCMTPDPLGKAVSEFLHSRIIKYPSPLWYPPRTKEYLPQREISAHSIPQSTIHQRREALKVQVFLFCSQNSKDPKTNSLSGIKIKELCLSFFPKSLCEDVFPKHMA